MRPRYPSLVVDEDVKKPSKQTNKQNLHSERVFTVYLLSAISKLILIHSLDVLAVVEWSSRSLRLSRYISEADLSRDIENVYYDMNVMSSEWHSNLGIYYQNYLPLDFKQSTGKGLSLHLDTTKKHQLSERIL